MIKTKNGSVKMKGNIFELKADLSIIVHNLYFDALTDMTPEKAKEHIMQAVERGLKTEEEFNKEFEDAMGGLLSIIGEMMKGQGEE